VSPPSPDSDRDTLALRHTAPEGTLPVSAPRPGATLGLAAGLLLALASSGAEAGTLRGTPEVVDASRMLVAGREIVLADIVVPAPGLACIIRSHPLDCGRLARAGLIDIVVGGEVECTAVGDGRHRCFASGYDIGFGLIHAGWAVPADGAPAHYKTKMREAKDRRRGLWSALPEAGEAPSVAHRLQR
jgi:endonuclease YncB( thermonuclease family)